jgi:hypothetical protein
MTAEIHSKMVAPASLPAPVLIASRIQGSNISGTMMQQRLHFENPPIPP